MGNLSVEEEVAGHLIRRLDEEESLQILRNLPDRLRDLSVKHRSFTETQRWDEIANLQSENGTIVESGILMADEKFRTRKSAWVDYTQNIHKEVDALQQSIHICIQEIERSCMPRRSKGKDTTLSNLVKSVNELHKRIGDVTDVMRVVAGKAIDVTGSPLRSDNNTGTAATGTNRGPGIRELNSPDIEGELWGGTGSSEALMYWELRVRELDGHCINMRNNLLLSGSILDEQQTTIDNLRRKLATAAARGPSGELSDEKPDSLLIGPRMTVFLAFFTFFVMRIIG